jgi:DNA-binding NtrC family response regulator
MSTIVVLAVCLDSLQPGTQDSAWKSAGYVFTPAGSISEAINHFKAGDFDLVLLGHSIPADSRERLTFLIRATGSHVPVISIAGASGLHDSFADATFRFDSGDLLAGMGKLLAIKAQMGPAPAILYGTAS